MRRLFVLCSVCATGMLLAQTGDDINPPVGSTPQTKALGDYVALGWNDLGMHCMQDDYSALCILPPYNNLWTQVILRGNPPQLVSSGIELAYRFPENTTSSGKVNFWDYEDQIFGVSLASDAGLTGNGLTGTMEWNGAAWEATGIPITPFSDAAPSESQPYQYAEVTVTESGGETALDITIFVAPVSTEMHCGQCHAGESGRTVWQQILVDHEEGIAAQAPVLCANCHASNALGTTGQAGLPNLSLAIHEKHKDKVNNDCYSCHPGDQTQCFRGAMSQAGLYCTDCHGSMETMAENLNNGRRPWIDEPQCATCHPDYPENDSTLYRNSTGHGGLYCAACHNSPHAILPTSEDRDGVQSLRVQGNSSFIKNCLVCHTKQPEGPGPHGIVTSWRIARHLEHVNPLTGDELARADYNEDGSVDTADVIWQVNRGL